MPVSDGIKAVQRVKYRISLVISTVVGQFRSGSRPLAVSHKPLIIELLSEDATLGHEKGDFVLYSPKRGRC